VAVHYAGVACNLAALRDIAQSANAALVEDAAQALGATYRGRPLGLFGDLSAFSFHATKNVTSGMGGALVVNNKSLIDRSQIIRDRGTDRKRFLNKEVDRYSWIDIGSAYAPSDLLAAFLLAQLEDLDQITSERLRLWMRYHESFEPVERAGRARRPIVPNDAAHNGHIYCLLLNEASCRRTVLAGLERRGVGAASHYVALHNTPAGMKFGRVAGTIAVTEAITDRIIRLPLHLSMSEDDQRYVIRSVIESIGA
jgi:dTDP-4-amino-4,6-dideoxygalactose transaminase